MLQRVRIVSTRQLFFSTRLLSAFVIVVFALMSTPSAEAATRADVRAIQTMLNELGYPSGRPDGAMGRNTRKAIRNYQRDNGLLTDGKASRELREHIEAKIETRNAGTGTKNAVSTAKKPSRAPALLGNSQGTSDSAANKPASRLLGNKRQTNRAATIRQNRQTSRAATVRQNQQSRAAPSAGQSRETKPATTLGKAVALRAGSLRQLPSTRSSQTGQYAANTRFDIYKRRGLWIEVATETGSARGWARLGTVRLLTGAGASRTGARSSAPSSASTPQQDSGNSGFSGFARSLTGWLGGGQTASRGNATSTIGIRGLTRGELSGNGRADMAALAQLDRIANPNAARTFARQGGLTAQSVPYPQTRARSSAPASTTSDDEVRD